MELFLINDEDCILTILCTYWNNKLNVNPQLAEFEFIRDRFEILTKE